jgi:HEPN domain-containing protein
MTEISELKSWSAHAEDDFGSAKTLLRIKKPYVSAVCFHAQQCAEKYLKALLVLKDVDFPKTHDLLTLVRYAIKTVYSQDLTNSNW